MPDHVSEGSSRHTPSDGSADNGGPAARADVVVIGGGHNGLVAGCYLARAGLEVVVVEAAPWPGGMATSGNYIATAPKHVITPCAVDLIVIRATPIIRDLELARHGLSTIEPDPPYAFLHPEGETVLIWRDPARTAKDIARFSEADSRAYLKLVETMTGMVELALPLMRSNPLRPSPPELARLLRAGVRHRRVLGELGTLATATCEQAVAERFEHPVTQSAMLALAAGAGPVDLEGSATSFLLLGLLQRVGVSRPVGGMQRFTDALVASLRASGGTLLTATPVREVLVRRERATGVLLEDGRQIESRAVLATCDPYTALRKLVPDGVLDRRTLARVDHIPANAHGASPLKIDIALSGRVTLPRHAHPDVDLRIPAQVYGTVEDTTSSFIAARRGELPTSPMMWAVVTSGADPTQAPPGQDVVYLYPPAMPAFPAGGWPAIKAEAEELVVKKAGEFFGNIAELEIGRLVETPDDMAERYRVHNGCIIHVDNGLMRAGSLRPAMGLGGYRTPIDGLFLGGSGSHPGGSMTGLPGRLSSQRVRQYLSSGRTRRHQAVA